MSNTIRTTVMAAAAATLAGVLLAAPAMASPGSGADPAGYGNQQGVTKGIGVRAGSDAAPSVTRGQQGSAGGVSAGQGVQDGTCVTTAESGTLTADEQDELMYWVEEEKVARDLYLAFADQYDLRVFERIAQSEQNHMDAVRALLDTYGLDDPSATSEPGEFTSAALQDLYDQLLEQGSASVEDALAVGQAVEIDDLGLLEDLGQIDAPDVAQVVGTQSQASTRHLAAFGG